jgi:2-polyprenyl-3-methyl-5-hydroxy-6-metoxy-1,4-benzoquinol methylase
MNREDVVDAESTIAEDRLFELQQTLYTSKNPTRRWLHCSRHDWIVRELEQAGPAGRALEVGPGSGIYLKTLAERYEKVVATDIENAYLRHLQPLTGRYGNLELLVDDVTASGLPSASFDLILCSEVIEHIEDSAPALAEMRRLLKPGGTLVLSTPQRFSTLELTAKIAFLPGIIHLVRRVYKEPVLETGHINLMTARQVTRQLEQAGFAIRKRHKSGLYLPLVAEFMGTNGLRAEQWLESRVRGSLLDGLLWTQYYVAGA